MTSVNKGNLRIFNQITETFSVNQLVELLRQAGAKRGYDVEVKQIQNPRIEQENHYYNPKYQGLKKIGIKPNLLTLEVLDNFFKKIESYKVNIKKEIIFNGIKW